MKIYPLSLLLYSILSLRVLAREIKQGKEIKSPDDMILCIENSKKV